MGKKLRKKDKKQLPFLKISNYRIYTSRRLKLLLSKIKSHRSLTLIKFDLNLLLIIKLKN